MSADTGDGGEHSYPINCRLRLRDTALRASITLKNASLGRRHCLRRWERVLFEHQPTLFIITLYSLPFSVELNFRQLTISLHHPLEAPCLTLAPVTVLRMQHHRQHTPAGSSHPAAPSISTIRGVWSHPSKPPTTLYSGTVLTGAATGHSEG